MSQKAWQKLSLAPFLLRDQTAPRITGRALPPALRGGSAPNTGVRFPQPAPFAPPPCLHSEGDSGV